MRARLFLFLIVFACSIAGVSAQSYDKMWKEINTMQKLDRPKSGLDLAQIIYKKAQQERNISQMLKAYMAVMEFREKITPDSLSLDIEGLERWLSETTEPLDAALLHSVLAEMYADYFSSRPIPFYRATASSSVSSDMTEWSGNFFIQKIFDHLRASLKEKELLIGTTVEAFKPIIHKGETSDYFRHDMFHLLGQRAISVLSPLKWRANDFYPQTVLEETNAFSNTAQFLSRPVTQASDYDCLGEIFLIYQSMLRYYTEKENLPASVLVDLNRLTLAYENTNKEGVFEASGFDTLKHTPYYIALNDLSNRYAQVDVCAEVYKKMADFALQSGYPSQAMNISQEALSKYSSYARINMFRQLEADILEPRLSGNPMETVYPSKMFDMKISSRNLHGFTLKFYRVNLPVESSLLNQTYDKSFRSKYTKFEKGMHFDLPLTPDFLEKDTTLKIVAPSEGIWLLEAVPDVPTQKIEPWLLYATQLKVINRSLPGNLSEFVVVDAQTGYPVSDADVILYRREENVMKAFITLRTNQEGTATTKDGVEYNAYRAQKDKDQAMPYVANPINRYSWNNYGDNSRELHLFTDRGIYRPGQTVYVAGVAYRIDGDSARVLADSDYTLALYDANYKMISEKKMKTNEFGSFAGEFQLPSLCLTGSFCIKAGSSRVWFRVDEYKRPTFDVTFNSIGGAYQVGDSVKVTGTAKTYSGVPVQNAKVRYTCRISYPYWLRRGSDINVASGSVQTNEKGEFSVFVYLKPQSGMTNSNNPYFNYIFNADVTDGAGETQNGQLRIPSGKNSLVLTCTLPQNLQKEGNDSLTVHVRNLEGEPQSVGGIMEVYMLSPASGTSLPVLGKQVLRESFVPNKTIKPVSLLNLPSGLYRLILSVKDSQGKEIKTESDFVLYSIDDNTPPYSSDCWFQIVTKEFGPDSPATILFGSSLRNVYVMYDLFSGDKHLEGKRIILTDSVMKMTYPCKAEYGDGLFVQFAFVKDGKLYQERAAIPKKLPNKKLTMRWDTFRDKLRPGQQEEWKLQILFPDGRPADAELLATLYDASLDKLAKNDWTFNLYFSRRIPRIEWKSPNSQWSYFNVSFPVKEWKYRQLVYDKLAFGPLNNVFVEEMSYSNGLVAADGMRSPRPAAMKMRSSASDVMAFGNTVPESEQGNGDELSSSEGIQVRENFAETAFFYPQLRTDKKGEVLISFMLPQSLTQWQFRGFSHTRTMDWEMIEATATASKDFMIAPNLPRFVRMGDQVSIAASVINLTGKQIAGTSVMELFNPENEKKIVSQKQNFTVKAGETTIVSFSFTVGENYPDLLACKMTARGDNFSDGEQRYIPVLSNKQQITESIPLVVEGVQTREFSLATLFNNNSKSAVNRKLTIEFTGNPAWYAVQALPSLSNPVSNNAISWASAFYANSVAANIANVSPRIKAIFDLWRQQNGNKEVLLSNLEKNQELKNILLNETPWVMEAANETEQKQRIATLFDLNTIQYNNSVAIDKLKELQQNGSWSWFKGMDASPYVTLFVAEALGRVSVLTGNPLPGDAAQLLSSTWNYLHQEVKRLYDSMIKTKSSGNTPKLVPDFILKYLYLGAITGENIPQVNREAYDFFVDRIAQSLAKQDLYQKALSAIILQQAGRTVDANNFVLSLKEYAVHSPGMGMYYDSKSASYSANSYRIPTQVAVLEAMQRVAKDMTTVEQMKIWLLRQKQTQSWNSPVATVNAIYALLERGANLLANDGNVKITLGGQVIDTQYADSSSAGLGYIKETFTGNQIKPGMKEVVIEKQNQGLSWGAVYAQYLENTDRVSAQGGPLSVDKELYVERMVDHRSLLIPLKEVTNVIIGDKIVVRITVKTDRDMDFVQLKDNRAACLEPLSSLSGYQMINRVGCYVAIKDASTEFFFDGLPKGTHVLEYAYFVTRMGDYTGGIATLQSAYAPEFTAHSGSELVKVTK